MEITEIKWSEASRELLISQLDYMADVRGSRKGDDATPISVGPFTGSYAELLSFFQSNPTEEEMHAFSMVYGYSTRNMNS
ncbi:TPA: hypothetical protein SLN44_001725 [Enterobacter cloacae]|nr:hypothetical protein [Enterobacter cloacae]